MQNSRHGYERPPLPGAGTMEDYTTAFLVSAGVLLFIGLFAVWSLIGMPVALAAAWLTNRAIPRR